jgi:hypothetical protein
MILEALFLLNDGRKGSTFQAIANQIENTYSVVGNFRQRLKNQIERIVEDGVLIEKNANFQINHIPDEKVNKAGGPRTSPRTKSKRVLQPQESPTTRSQQSRRSPKANSQNRTRRSPKTVRPQKLKKPKRLLAIDDEEEQEHEQPPTSSDEDDDSLRNFRTEIAARVKRRLSFG